MTGEVGNNEEFLQREDYVDFLDKQNIGLSEQLQVTKEALKKMEEKVSFPRLFGFENI